jgi:hypothetical protein
MYKCLGQYEEGLKYLLKAMKINEDISGIDHISTSG